MPTVVFLIGFFDFLTFLLSTVCHSGFLPRFTEGDVDLPLTSTCPWALGRPSPPCCCWPYRRFEEQIKLGAAFEVNSAKLGSILDLKWIDQFAKSFPLLLLAPLYNDGYLLWCGSRESIFAISPAGRPTNCDVLPRPIPDKKGCGRKKWPAPALMVQMINYPPSWLLENQNTFTTRWTTAYCTVH